jgi:prepilin-type N-terminal cleavage/methylation domain-containing protein
MILKFKKGFSLVELLVVIAIIGILAAVGITAYQGYTQSAKEKAVLANHSQLVKFLNAEMAKCAGGEGYFVWNDTAHNDDKCDKSQTGEHNGQTYATGSANAARIVLYVNGTLGIKNPYNINNPASGVGVSGFGEMAIACAVDNGLGTNGCTVQSYWDNANTGAIVVPYM